MPLYCFGVLYTQSISTTYRVPDALTPLLYSVTYILNICFTYKKCNLKCNILIFT